MSNKLTAIKIKLPNGTYSEQILISVLAQNVKYDNTRSLNDILNLLDNRINAVHEPVVSQPTRSWEGEVADIRNGYDGTAYQNAGIAVRTQIINLANSMVKVDDTLTTQGAAADAEKTGDEIADLKSAFDSFEGISDEVKQALLACFENVAWIGPNGKNYYNDLESALYNSGATLDISVGEIVSNLYFDDNNNETPISSGFINRRYIPIKENTQYTWIQGQSSIFAYTSSDGNIVKANETSAYRVLFYDNNKNFIKRIINTTDGDPSVMEPGYFTFTSPNNAKYIRVSWGKLPCGLLVESIPNDIYSVNMVLAFTDDRVLSEADISTLTSKFSIIRNGKDITNLILTGIDNYIFLPVYNDILYWWIGVFSVLDGRTPEEEDEVFVSKKRIYNRKQFIMKKGDIIRFHDVKAGVVAKKIIDGTVEAMSSWITTDTDYVVGAGEV